ncbi:transcription regulator HTH, apses-type DNA-binding domain-containing protein [Neohortaea acidophila]|uniref:Transcription regulator HTH, apses-type DNA-binding domain-containing protein n=1 Tax=Neohortaea acidophila TaxID=245834 RepID=A0A6A6Q9Q8_9PEZI|nr:transcription regulator HTH, apses-type DNA-binding domain-containing protein [Neohortaea acidophila]KAF2488147.1 transcription regulator HTH, apses-type DNA-binding domain-containing protein [Neohortaea acidophila]
MSNRSLPEARNPLLTEDAAPMYENLVERRCLGQTELKVKPGQVGTTNATKPDNLGVLDYAHLRVPLPRDLSSSGIFLRQANRKWPEAYFLMRRSTDGYISATGMFKAAFPWAQTAEEAAEKEYIKSLEQTSDEEVAGNVWIHPDQALLLADEYGIRRWIEALLDPEAITHGTSDPKKQIKSPPPYRISKSLSNGPSTSKTPSKASHKRTSSKASKAGQDTLSVPPDSPTKKTPARKIATPRKPRKSRGKSAEPDAALLNGAEKAKVEVEAEIEQALLTGEEKVKATKINVEVPAERAASGGLQDAPEIVEKAKEMVSEAAKLAVASGPSGNKGKRKAKELEEDLEEELSPAGGDAKRIKTSSAAALELRKERIRRRALTGIAASLAIGALVPSILAALGS